ncbi:MAG: hypothetical protein P1V51_01190 [Deltaproteobacteria bacterium]|nr:hypothetical protein [Deltaproteobacteria bacterium]
MSKHRCNNCGAKVSLSRHRRCPYCSVYLREADSPETKAVFAAFFRTQQKRLAQRWGPGFTASLVGGSLLTLGFFLAQLVFLSIASAVVFVLLAGFLATSEDEGYAEKRVMPKLRKLMEKEEVPLSLVKGWAGEVLPTTSEILGAVTDLQD